MGRRSGLERKERGPGRAGWDHGEVGQGRGRGQGRARGGKVYGQGARNDALAIQKKDTSSERRLRRVSEPLMGLANIHIWELNP